MKAKIFAAAFVALTAGGAVSALAQDVVVIPNEVDTYVMEQPYDDNAPVVVDEDITVGSVLPDTVVVQPVPQYDDYSYAVVNKRRVVIEPSTRRVIKVYE
jgi:Flp pilus assembly protein CpaB